MKHLTQTFLVAFLVLFSIQSFSQTSLSTLQKLALLNSNNVYTLPVEIREILEPKGYKNIQRRWIKSSPNIGKEIITINATFEGNMISYELYNLPKCKALVESIKKLGNIVFNNDDGDKTHFRNTDKKLNYDVLYTNNYSRCVIAIFKYSEPPKKEDEKIDSVETKESATMVAFTKDAEFIGGETALTKYISQSIDKPDDLDWSGRLVVQFFIEKDGSVNDVEVKGNCPTYFKNSIIATFKKMPNWKPAQLSDGTTARTSKQMPLQF